MSGRNWRLGTMIPAGILLTATMLPAAEYSSAPLPDNLVMFKAYAKAMIEHGRDVYGQTHSPLVAEELDADTRTGAIEEGGCNLVRRMGYSPPRPDTWHRQSPALRKPGPGPVCPAAISGDKRLADEAECSRKFFHKQCESPVTGVFWCGGYAGWDLRAHAHDVHLDQQQLGGWLHFGVSRIRDQGSNNRANSSLTADQIAEVMASYCAGSDDSKNTAAREFLNWWE